MSLRRKLLVWIVALLGLVLVAVAAGWWWLTATRGGAEFVLDRAAGALERLEWDRLSGNLARGLRVEGVELDQAGTSVRMQQVDVTVRVRPGWPVHVHVRELRIAGLVVNLPPAPDDAPEAEPFRMPDLSAPVVAVIDAFVLESAEIRPADGAPLIIDRLALAAVYDRELRITGLDFRAGPATATGNARMGLRSPWSLDLEIAGDWQLEPDHLQHVELDASGSLEDIAASFTARGPVSGTGEVRVSGLPTLDALSGEIRLRGDRVEWPGLDGTIRQLELDASGGLQRWQAQTAFDLEWPEVPPAHLDLALRGAGQEIAVERGVVDVLDGRVRLDGQARLGPEPAAGMRLELENLDFTPLYPEWPNQARLSGGMQVDFDGALAIRDLSLRAPPAPLRLSGEADLDPDSGVLAVDLQWQDLTWPPVTDGSEPLIASQSGSLQASGTLDDWRAELDALYEIADLPSGRIRAESTGDRESAVFQALELELEGAGRVAARGRAGWADGVRANLSVDVIGLDPGRFEPRLPGRVDARLALNLDAIEPLSADLTLSALEGQLRGQALNGSGRLAVRGDAAHEADLSLTLGDNVLEVSSPDGTDWAVDLTAGRLDQLWPDVAGALEINARLVPARGEVEWTARGEALAYADFRLAELTSGGRGNWRQDPAVDARVELADLDLNPWERLERVEIALAGNCAVHELTLTSVGGRAGLELTAGGTLPECMNAPGNWQGRIRSLALTETLAGDWSLDSPLPVHIQDGRVVAGGACLVSGAAPDAEDGPGAGRLCVEELDLAEGGRTGMRLAEVPLDLLLIPLDPVFRITSRLDGQLAVAWDGEGLTAVNGNLQLGAGSLRGLGASEDLLAIKGVRLEFESPGERNLHARLEAALEGNSVITGDARIPDVRDLADMELNAMARLELPDLAAFNRLVPELDRLEGSLTGELQVAGLLADPDLSGHMALRDGLLLYAPLGTRIEALEAELAADANATRLQGSFRAGDGQARFRGDLNTGSGQWNAGLSLSGESLQLFDVSWLELTASPDLEIGLRAERMDLNGEIGIGRARLGLPPGADERVAESADVVVAGETEGEEDAEELPTRALAGTVGIRLGDDVRLAAAGMQTRLAGNLDLNWNPDEAIPRGEGIIYLRDGSYRAYGQNLEVDDGEVIFTGHPVDNPRLEIEAVREIFGDPRVEFAGVRIRGSAREPDISLFTRPPTTEEKALAYVLTGADFDHGGGQGAFSVGFWVLPKLFVSYGLGLFDTGNVLAARYELSRRWGLRATSGERDTGADISYVVDR